MLITGHFYAEHSPYILTKNHLSNTSKLKVVGDISCDIGGPIVSTIRPSTIDDPIYGFHKSNSIECDFLAPDAIAIMAVDNLPCELPRDSSEMFSEMFFKHVIPSFFNDDKYDILKNSQITSKGQLTPRFNYLSDYFFFISWGRTLSTL